MQHMLRPVREDPNSRPSGRMFLVGGELVPTLSRDGETEIRDGLIDMAREWRDGQLQEGYVQDVLRDRRKDIPMIVTWGIFTLLVNTVGVYDAAVKTRRLDVRYACAAVDRLLDELIWGYARAGR